MIEKVTLQQAVADSNIIEAIRANMPTATYNKKGLVDRGVFMRKFVSLAPGESVELGKCLGLLEVHHSWTNAMPSISLVSNYFHSIRHIAGRNISDIPLELTWEGEGYDSTLTAKSTYSDYNGETTFNFTYQYIEMQ